MKTKPLLIGLIVGLLLVRLMMYLNEERRDAVAINLEMEDLYGFIGSWESEIDNGKYLETWKLDTVSGNLKGNGYYFSLDDDTLFKEHLSIIQIQSKIALVAQIENKITLFSLVENQNEFVFANYEHDHPKMIKYTFKEDTMHIEVIGNGLFGENVDKLELERN
jgi:hypothetical protein